MQIEIVARGKTWLLSDEHSGSCYGVPVLVGEDGTQYGPWDVADANPDAYVPWMVYARAIAGFARDDHPDDAEVIEFVRRYEAIPYNARA